MYVGTCSWPCPAEPPGLLLRVPYLERPSSVAYAAYQCSFCGAMMIEIAGKNSDLIMKAPTLRDAISQWTILNFLFGPRAVSSSFSDLMYWKGQREIMTSQNDEKTKVQFHRLPI